MGSPPAPSPPGGLALSGGWRSCCGVARYRPRVERRGGKRRLAASEGAAGRRRSTRRRGRKRPTGGAGEDRPLEGCARASFSHFVAEIAWQCLAQRAGHAPLHPIWSVHGDGRLGRGARLKNAVHGRRDAGCRIEAEPHVTAIRDRRRPAHGAGVRAMEGASGRHGDGSSQTVRTRGLGLLGGLNGAKARRDAGGTTGVSEVRLIEGRTDQQSVREPRWSAEAGRAV